MFSRFQKPIAFASRQFSTSTARNKTVAVMGASGGMLKVKSQLVCDYCTSKAENVIYHIIKVVYQNLSYRNWSTIVNASQAQPCSHKIKSL